jgi:hypothetical protein
MKSNVLRFILCIIVTFVFDKPIKIVAQAKDQKTPQDVVLQFYNWYFKTTYMKTNEGPDVKLVDSKYQIVAERLFNKLKKTGFFSDEFFKNQLIIYNACNVQLKKVNVKDVEKCGCSPAEFVKTTDCDFLSSFPWVGGQGESLNTVKVLKVKTIGNTSKVTATITDSHVDYSHPEVTLVKENDGWKIAKIDLHY